MTVGGIIVCGGRSRRMGRPKLTLPFGPETMLARIARLLAEVVDPVVVVGACDQQIPPLPDSVLIARDRQPDRGPLEGLAVGLAAVKPRADAAFVTACDVPLLAPRFVQRMVALADGYEIAVPHIEGFDEPLTAVYGVGVVPHIEQLLAADRLRPVFLFDAVRTRRVAAEELADVDPEFNSLFNVNTPANYSEALKRAGLDR